MQTRKHTASKIIGSNEMSKEKIYDFVLNILTHPIGCPKWGKPSKECTCGLEEIRKLIKEEQNGK
jgi:hypothetical protein